MAPTDRVWQQGSALIEKLKHFYMGSSKSWQEPQPEADRIISTLIRITDPTVSSSYTKADSMVAEDDKPLISESTALWSAVLFTVLYIAPFYLSPTLRATPLTSRDAPSVIKARIRAVIFSCIASTAIAVYILFHYGQAEVRDVLRLFALWPINPLDCLKVLTLVGILFTGPLFETVVVDGGWREWSLRLAKEVLWDSWPGYRNYIVAPISEELVFRSLVISLYLLAKVSSTRIVFLTPLIFGVAHVHHLVEFVQSRIPPGRTFPSVKDLLIGIIRSLFQFSYTSLFGFFAAFVYLRTGNVFASILSHAFCNFMGLPRLWGRVGQYEEWAPRNTTPDVAQGKRDETSNNVRVGNGVMVDQDPNETRAAATLLVGQRNIGAGWTVMYYVLLFAGAFGFYRLLWTLTDSSGALASF